MLAWRRRPFEDIRTRERSKVMALTAHFEFMDHCSVGRYREGGDEARIGRSDAAVQLSFSSKVTFFSRPTQEMIGRMRATSAMAICAAVLLTLTAPTASAHAADLVGAARIRSDASLSIHGRAIRLAGIYVPPTSRFCQTFESPVHCGSRAALALDFHIGARFVYCDVLAWDRDGSAVAGCWITGRHLGERDDLAAWLISHGWALALPDAPFEYVALERIARAQGRGVWGFIVDRID